LVITENYWLPPLTTACEKHAENAVKVSDAVSEVRRESCLLRIKGRYVGLADNWWRNFPQSLQWKESPFFCPQAPIRVISASAIKVPIIMVARAHPRKT